MCTSSNSCRFVQTLSVFNVQLKTHNLEPTIIILYFHQQFSHFQFFFFSGRCLFFGWTFFPAFSRRKNSSRKFSKNSKILHPKNLFREKSSSSQTTLWVPIVYADLPFFLEFGTSQSVPWAQPRTNEPLQRKETQTK